MSRKSGSFCYVWADAGGFWGGDRNCSPSFISLFLQPKPHLPSLYIKISFGHFKQTFAAFTLILCTVKCLSRTGYNRVIIFWKLVSVLCYNFSPWQPFPPQKSSIPPSLFVSFVHASVCPSDNLSVCLLSACDAPSLAAGMKLGIVCFGFCVLFFEREREKGGKTKREHYNNNDAKKSSLCVVQSRVDAQNATCFKSPRTCAGLIKRASVNDPLTKKHTHLP